MLQSVEQLQNNPELDRERRFYNDTTTWAAEMLHGTMRTGFEYRYNGYDLVAEDNGSAREFFTEALNEAVVMAEKNPEMSFEHRRRVIEMGEFEDMLSMAAGEKENTMIVLSDFPSELMDAQQDVGGYNVSRKQTMMRVVSRLPDGSIRVVSQSLDGSNREALSAIYSKYGKTLPEGELLSERIEADLPPEDQEHLADKLMGVYDRSLSRQFGGEWHAGIKQTVDKPLIETYQFVCAQQDLIGWFVEQKIRDPVGAEASRLGLAATLTERYESALRKNYTLYPVQGAAMYPALEHELHAEIEAASQRAIVQGRVFSGCGASIGAEAQLREAGYGNMSYEDHDRFGPLTFTCPAGHHNRRPRGRLISKCQAMPCNAKVTC